SPVKMAAQRTKTFTRRRAPRHIVRFDLSETLRRRDDVWFADTRATKPVASASRLRAGKAGMLETLSTSATHAEMAETGAANNPLLRDRRTGPAEVTIWSFMMTEPKYENSPVWSTALSS